MQPVNQAIREYKGKDDGLCDIEITEEKIINKLGKLRDDKSGGADELVPRFLNSIKHNLKVPLAILFRKIFNDGQVPSDWKDANVVPIFKSGKWNSVSNYRPISLTIVNCVRLSKPLFEMILLNFLKKMSS